MAEDLTMAELAARYCSPQCQTATGTEAEGCRCRCDKRLHGLGRDLRVPGSGDIVAAMGPPATLAGSTPGEGDLFEHIDGYDATALAAS